MSTDPTLTAEAMTCVRDGRALFEELTVQVEASQLLQIEGVNGAGKTSLLRILCGLSEPREGIVYWRGQDIRVCRPIYHRELLYIGHNPGIKPELTPLENLRFFGALTGHSCTESALETALEQIGLYGYEHTKVAMLSAGQRRRVGLARLWLNDAPLWILDEPFTAIDRDGIANLEARLGSHVQAGGLAVITSHQTLGLDDGYVRHLRLQ
ncbi:MAG: cytochrome c biogenesis heme-transporting ATPase CcmA [Candidatus Competibacteraceae bacterium]|nr:cytochrome c biogenesis heme-transporting ATPase CcmA [Candidatus Competibacteraceae bacterium]